MAEIVKQSKPITELQQGDKVKINGKEFEVDDNVLLIDHGNDVKEMALEIFDKNDKDYQLRYFPSNLENTLEIYELVNDFIYTRSDEEVEKVEW